MKDGTVFKAKYAGQCPECAEMFDEGDMVEAVETSNPKVFHYKHANEKECTLFRDKATKFQGTTLDEMGY